MKTTLLVVVVSALSSAAVLAASRASGAPRRAAAAPPPAAEAPAPGDMPLRVIGQTGSTEVLHFRHNGHDCYVANARNAAGISLQCAGR